MYKFILLHVLNRLIALIKICEMCVGLCLYHTQLVVATCSSHLSFPRDFLALITDSDVMMHGWHFTIVCCLHLQLYHINQLTLNWIAGVKNGCMICQEIGSIWQHNQQVQAGGFSFATSSGCDLMAVPPVLADFLNNFWPTRMHSPCHRTRLHRRRTSSNTTRVPENMIRPSNSGLKRDSEIAAVDCVLSMTKL